MSGSVSVAFEVHDFTWITGVSLEELALDVTEAPLRFDTPGNPCTNSTDPSIDWTTDSTADSTADSTDGSSTDRGGLKSSQASFDNGFSSLEWPTPHHFPKQIHNSKHPLLNNKYQETKLFWFRPLYIVKKLFVFVWNKICHNRQGLWAVLRGLIMTSLFVWNLNYLDAFHQK